MEKLLAIFENLPGVDKRSVKFLIDALNKNNLPGFDYLEFKQAVGAMKAMHMDEATAIQSAFTTASTVGLTKEKLLESANFYQKILSSEQGKFAQALQQQTKIQIAGKQNEINKKKEQIAQLQAEIQRHEAHIAKAQQEIEQSKHKIFGAKENFEQTYAIVKEELTDDITKITTILS